MADRLIKSLQSGQVVYTLETDTIVCDFCCNRSMPVKWQFNATDAMISHADKATEPNMSNTVLRMGKVLVNTKAALTTESIGGRWAACDRCKDLVEREMPATLAAVSGIQYIMNNNLKTTDYTVIDAIIQSVVEAQKAFWDNWDKKLAKPWP